MGQTCCKTLISFSLLLLSPPAVPQGPAAESQKNEKWKVRYGSSQRTISFYGFEKASSEGVQEARSVLADMPASFAGAVSSWFQSQVDRLPQEKWPKESWLENRVEAQRIEKWCGMILEVLEGFENLFDSVGENLSAQKVYFSMVSSYQGSISLRLAIWPYAEVRTLRIGEEWVIREGNVSGDIEVSGENLYTPLEIRNLDIGEYVLVLFQKDLGEKEIHLKSGKMKNGETYVCSGSLSEPDSIRLSLLP